MIVTPKIVLRFWLQNSRGILQDAVGTWESSVILDIEREDFIMADFWDHEEVVGKIAKNNREEIHIKKVEKKGKKYVDIRVFWFDGESDEFRPSQKGVTVAYESFAEFRELISGIELE